MSLGTLVCRRWGAGSQMIFQKVIIYSWSPQPYEMALGLDPRCCLFIEHYLHFESLKYGLRPWRGAPASLEQDGGWVAWLNGVKN